MSKVAHSIRRGLEEALAYAERAGIACVWIDDPDGHFPPEKRPMHDAISL